MGESRLWSWHIITAVIILVLLGLHMGIMHLGGILNALGIGPGESVHSDNVFHRSQQLFFMVTYILLLGAALFHGLYGLRSMLCELSLSRTVERTLGGLFAVAGFGLFIYGSYVAIALFQMKGVQP
jgi:succinate dehydrogenase / fumarate reductase membrane anchor subunit